MAQVAFDTLKFVTKLKTAGWTESAAIAFSEIQNETLIEAMNNTLATKEDIHTLQSDVRTMKEDIHTLQSDVRTMKEDIHTLQSDVRTMKEDIHTLQDEISTVQDDIRALEYKMEQHVTSLNHKIEQVETRFEIKLEKAIAPLRTNIITLNWMCSVIISGIGALVIKTFFN